MLTNVLRGFRRARSYPCPSCGKLPCECWEITNYSFEVDWFGGPKGVDVSSPPATCWQRLKASIGRMCRSFY